MILIIKPGTAQRLAEVRDYLTDTGWQAVWLPADWSQVDRADSDSRTTRPIKLATQTFQRELATATVGFVISVLHTAAIEVESFDDDILVELALRFDAKT